MVIDFYPAFIRYGRLIYKQIVRTNINSFTLQENYRFCSLADAAQSTYKFTPLANQGISVIISL